MRWKTAAVHVLGRVLSALPTIEIYGIPRHLPIAEWFLTTCNHTAMRKCPRGFWPSNYCQHPVHIRESPQETWVEKQIAAPSAEWLNDHLRHLYAGHLMKTVDMKNRNSQWPETDESGGPASRPVYLRCHHGWPGLLGWSLWTQRQTALTIQRLPVIPAWLKPIEPMPMPPQSSTMLLRSSRVLRRWKITSSWSSTCNVKTGDLATTWAFKAVRLNAESGTSLMPPTFTRVPHGNKLPMTKSPVEQARSTTASTVEPMAHEVSNRQLIGVPGSPHNSMATKPSWNTPLTLGLRSSPAGRAREPELNKKCSKPPISIITIINTGEIGQAWRFGFCLCSSDQAEKTRAVSCVVWSTKTWRINYDLET